MKKGRMTRIGCYGPNSGNIERCAECMAHDRSCSIGRHVEEEDTLNARASDSASSWRTKRPNGPSTRTYPSSSSYPRRTAINGAPSTVHRAQVAHGD
jgi:hypothetical protein